MSAPGRVAGALAAALIAYLAIALVGAGCVFYLSPSCADQIHNGDETDIDCGGRCGKCDLGARCAKDADCDEGTCTGGVCTPLPCANGKLDPGETDVDCGGPTCHKCSGGRACAAATDCFSGTCVAGAGTCQGLATLTFAAAAMYPSGSKTYALFAGDLDRDGDLDLVAANEQDSAVAVFLNDGAGVMTKQPMTYKTGEYPTGGTITDMNGDGIPDVVTADYHGDSVSVLLGVGDGTLMARATYPTVAGGETSTLAVGDVNGDGRPDVIATNPMRATASVFLGGVGGALTAAAAIPVGPTVASEPYSAAIGDFDRDGKADVAIADNLTGVIWVRRGAGDGTFADAIAYPVGGLSPYILTARDVNVDGQLDLICANRGGDSVSVLIGRGDGTFRKARVTSTGKGTGPYSVAVADFNLDGVPDIATANFMSGNATILLGVGDGSFDPVVVAGKTASAGRFSYGVIAGDLNGDGKPDLAAANPDDNSVSVLLSTAH